MAGTVDGKAPPCPDLLSAGRMGPGWRRGSLGQGGPWECPSWDSPQALSREASERYLIKSVKVLASRAGWGGGENAAISVPLLSLPEGEQCDGIRCLNALICKSIS